jgi:hypothetical protein
MVQLTLIEVETEHFLRCGYEKEGVVRLTCVVNAGTSLGKPDILMGSRMLCLDLFWAR